MANKKIFSYGNNGKRKVGHSKFDMGHEHIMSANFGGLHTAACFETLPDDYWDISDNTVTLLKPLTAPAFARINQNFYGAYVRNQQIWKYWNDYISNGTAFGDVYGNNVTNQSLQNAWDVPSIPAPYLQTILKIGYGNATPVWHLEFHLTGATPQSQSETIVAFFVKNVSLRNMSNNTAYRVTDAFTLFCKSIHILLVWVIVKLLSFFAILILLIMVLIAGSIRIPVINIICYLVSIALFVSISFFSVVFPILLRLLLLIHLRLAKMLVMFILLSLNIFFLAFFR